MVVRYFEQNVPDPLAGSSSSSVAQPQPPDPQAPTPSSAAMDTRTAPSRLPSHVENTTDFIGKLTARMKAHIHQHKDWDFQLSPQHLSSLGVCCTPLELTSSDPSAGPGDGTGFQFVRPIPLQTLDEWLQEKQPSRSTEFVSPGPKEPSYRRSKNAEFLMGHFMQYLECAEGDCWSRRFKGPYAEGVMRDKTLWRRNPSRWKFMEPNPRHVLEGLWFRVDWVLDHGDDYPLSSPTSKPHIVACLCDNAAMREDGLMLSELITILHLTVYRFLTEVWDYRIVPVTIISVSDHDVRLIHAYVDAQESRVNVRKSRIMKFDEGEDQDMENWKRLMCWAIATPDLNTVRKLESLQAK